VTCRRRAAPARPSSWRDDDEAVPHPSCRHLVTWPEPQRCCRELDHRAVRHGRESHASFELVVDLDAAAPDVSTEGSVEARAVGEHEQEGECTNPRPIPGAPSPRPAPESHRT
jgi:hypothetical protein